MESEPKSYSINPTRYEIPQLSPEQKQILTGAVRTVRKLVWFQRINQKVHRDSKQKRED